MRSPNVTDPQFVDAAGTGGFNAMFGLVSGSIATLGAVNLPLAGLLSPEVMTVSLVGLAATVGLPPPWGLVTSAGVIVRAHGTQTGQDTTNYSVNFASLVPGSGSVTAYLGATVTTIQQNPFPLTGPPAGHPSFNPNFVPTVAYATNTYTVSLAATTTPPNNTTIFEVFRTTLTAGQVTLTAPNFAGQMRAASYTGLPSRPQAAGGILVPGQALGVLSPTAAGLTHTLPAANTAGGLEFIFANANGPNAWTIAAQGADRITGALAAGQTSLVIPPSGAVTLWGNAASGQWHVLAGNPMMMASLPNAFTAQQTISSSALAALILSGGGVNGTGLQIIGNGTVTPSKFLRVTNGVFGILNDTYSLVTFSVDDVGNVVALASVTTAILTANSTTTLNGVVNANNAVNVAGVLTANGNIITRAGFYSAGLADIGGILTARAAVTAIGAISTNGALTAGGALSVGTNANIFGSLTVNNASTFNSTLYVGSQITAGGNIVTNALVQGGNVSATNTIVAGGRLRAAYGAYGSGDPNAATLLADFITSRSSPGYHIDPDGFIIQWGSTPESVPVDNQAHLYNLPIAFPNFGTVTGNCGAFAPVAGAMLGIQIASNYSQFYVTVASSSPGGSLGCWFLAAGW